MAVYTSIWDGRIKKYVHNFDRGWRKSHNEMIYEALTSYDVCACRQILQRYIQGC
jgi:hypothetical protein